MGWYFVSVDLNQLQGKVNVDQTAACMAITDHKEKHCLVNFRNGSLFVTWPGKTGLIYIKYTCLWYGMYLLFCMCYPTSVNFIEFLMNFCIYNDILDTIQIIEKKLLHFKLSKSGQILHVGKTCFPRPSHICLIQKIFILQIFPTNSN